MYNRMAFRNYQSMNMVYRADNGNEIWLGDYYAATDPALLKSKQITAGRTHHI